MATITTKEQLIEYSFRQLGKPVVDINVDYQQAEDRLDDALQYFIERHFDGVEKAYFKYEVTQEDIDNSYVDTDALPAVNGADGPTGKDIVSVVKVFQFGDFSTINMFDVRYQMALSDYFGINRGLGGNSSLGLASYDSTKRYINLIEDMFQPEKAIRFSKVRNKLFMDTNWSEELDPGEFLIIEAYVALDPEKYGEIYNDRYLKRYFTALLKKQWGQNLSKFDNVQLPGGVVLRGGQIVQEANMEIQQIEQEIFTNYELPVDFMTG